MIRRFWVPVIGVLVLCVAEIWFLNSKPGRALDNKAYYNAPLGNPSMSVPRDTDPAFTSTPAPAIATQADEDYVGRIDALPEAAVAVLRFEPAESDVQTQGTSIAERVESACGMTDYVGSSDFPGSIHVAPPREHGWVRVTWKVHGCQSIGSDLYKNPVMVFDISEDREHLKDVSDAALFLTH
jgi:hypothetical protein